MDDSFPVSGSQPAGHLLHDLDRFRNFQFALLLQDLMEVLALQILHRDELCLSRFSDIENADDIPVRDLARKNQLLLEALQDLRMLRHFGPDYFERDLSLQFHVSSLVDRAHAAFTEQLQKFITSAEQIANPQYGSDVGRRRARRRSSSK